VDVEAAYRLFLEERFEFYSESLRFAELRKGVQALSTFYVQERKRLGGSKIFSSLGKRAAFELYYAPRHFYLLREILRGLGQPVPPGRLFDLGCGNGICSAAWASLCQSAPKIVARDISSHAVDQAKVLYRALDLRANVGRGSVLKMPDVGAGDILVLGFVVNELSQSDRQSLKRLLLNRVRKGSGLLLIEPLAKTPSRWWEEWVGAFPKEKAREDMWKFSVDLPTAVFDLGKAAGLRPAQLGARSLYVQP